MMFVCKINGQNGKVKWVKEFHPNQKLFNNSTENIVTDDENNIYLSFLFSDFNVNFGSFQVSSTLSPANGLLKMDSEGNFVWAKCHETPWTDMYGTSRALKYDSISHSIFDVIGQGGYNWSSSCKYSPFNSILYKISNEGEIVQLNSIHGDDLNGSSVMELTTNNSIFVSGFYRGLLDISPLSLNSTWNKKADCNNWEQFYTNFNAKNGNVLSLKGTPNDVFYPFDICSDNRFIYVLGAELINSKSYYSLSIRRFTHLGRFQGKRKLNECYSQNPFDFNEYFNIALNGNSHFLISMSSTSRISPFDNFVEDYYGLSVYRLLKDVDWSDEPYSNENETISGIIVAPNPADDLLQLQFSDPKKYSKLIVYNSLGQLVQTIELSGDVYQTIDIENLRTGLYVLEFQGQNNQSIKLIIN